MMRSSDCGKSMVWHLLHAFGEKAHLTIETQALHNLHQQNDAGTLRRAWLEY